MLTTGPAIDARGLRKEFGSTVAVAGLTLQVNRGEVFGFLGPNGAGKTTAMKMLLGLTKPTAGTATLLDNSLGDRETRAQIGFLPEHFRFHEWLRAGEFLDFHGRLYGMNRSRREAVVPDLLELVGLADQRDTRLRAFSKGMLQRIGLAQSLLNDPKLVFLDEPTSGLDPLGRRLVRDIINGLRDEGTAVFLNSHFLSEVEKTCDRVAFIREGTVVKTVSLLEGQQNNLLVTLRVSQPTSELVEKLNQFGEGAKLQKRDGRIVLTMPDESKLPDLAQWLVQSGYNLYELSPHLMSLEEQFLQVIGGS